MESPQWLQRASAVRRIPERWQTPLLIVAGVVFVVGTVVAYQNLSVEWQHVNLWLLTVVLLAGTPATVAVNAAELRVITRAGGARMAWRAANRTVVMATAANMLPVPGAAVVRTHALLAHGVPLGTAIRVTVAAALSWVGVSAMLAACASLTLSAGVAGLLGVGGTVATVAGIVALRSTSTVAGQLLFVEAATTAIHALRLWLVLIALTVPVDLREPVVIAAAAPLAAAAGIFPSGLGLAEALSAGLAATIGFSAAAGFAATALMRVIGLAGTAVVAFVLGVKRSDTRVQGRPADRDEHA